MNPTSMPKPQQNKRETGGRKYPASRQHAAETDTHAGMPTANPFGLTQPEDETTGGDAAIRRRRPAEADDADAAAAKFVASHC